MIDDLQLIIGMLFSPYININIFCKKKKKKKNKKKKKKKKKK